jgi:hypothetical protein
MKVFVLVLTASGVAFVLLLHMYQIQDNFWCTFTNVEVSENFDKIKSITYPVYQGTNPCPKAQPCVEKICPKPVIKMKEMTKVLNERNITREAVFFTETSGTGRIKPR